MPRFANGEARNGPVGDCWAGPAQDISRIVTVLEQDDGDPNAYRAEIDLVTQTAAGVALAFEVFVPRRQGSRALRDINPACGSANHHWDSLRGLFTSLLCPVPSRGVAANEQAQQRRPR